MDEYDYAVRDKKGNLHLCGAATNARHAQQITVERLNRQLSAQSVAIKRELSWADLAADGWRVVRVKTELIRDEASGITYPHATEVPA